MKSLQRLATFGRHNSAITINRWRFIIIIHYQMIQFPFLPLESIQSHSLACTLHTRNLIPNFLRRRTQVDGTADNADISQSQVACDDRLLSHVTLGRVKCRKQTASVQISERFEPNTVLWAFHKIVVIEGSLQTSKAPRSTSWRGIISTLSSLWQDSLRSHCRGFYRIMFGTIKFLLSEQ